MTECLGSPSQDGLSRLLDLSPHPSRPGAPGQRSPVFSTFCPPSPLGTRCLRNLESQSTQEPGVDPLKAEETEAQRGVVQTVGSW